jgi:hypothetical protein
MRMHKDQRIDLVHVGSEAGGDRSISGYAKCMHCGAGYRATDAVVRMYDYSALTPIAEYTVHRRCMEALLDGGVEDEPRETAKFIAYRNQLADRLGLSV